MAGLTIDVRATAAERPRRPSFPVLTPSNAVWPSMAPLRRAISDAADGDCVAFAVPLDTPPLQRLLTLTTLRWHRRRAERAIRDAGAEVVAHFGVDPSLAQPSWMYELDTVASEYADRFMRPKGSNLALRRVAQHCFGCDPALGAVLVLARKPRC